MKKLIILLAFFAVPACQSNNVVEPQLIPATQCVYVDAVEPIADLQNRGYDVDYRDHAWYVNGDWAGFAAYEDTNTTICYKVKN